METQVELEKRLLPQLTETIVKEVLGAGGGAIEIQLLVEGLAALLMTAIIEHGHDEAVDIMARHIKQRIARRRADEGPTVGNA